MLLHRFLPDGLAVFEEFLDSLTTDTRKPWPASALSDPHYSAPVSPEVEVNARSFESRFELAESLHQAFDDAGYKPSRGDKELWAWLACFYFQSVCPKKRQTGEWEPGARQRWILQSADWRRYYRHLVAGPYGIYRAHLPNPERAMAVLCQPPGRPGDVVEQLASRQEIVATPAVMATATRLFVDPKKKSLRRGAGGKGTGSARRFVAVLDQFDLTWDFAELGDSELLALMPSEFKAKSAAG